MKKSTIKLVAFGMLVLMLLSIFTVPVKAETYEKVVLKKANKEFFDLKAKLEAELKLEDWKQIENYIMGIDYITGLIVAGVFNNSPKTNSGALESRAGWKGLFRKCVTLLMVLIACRLDMVLNTTFIRDCVVIAYIANETISIIENAGLMGIPIPSVIVKAIDVLKSKAEDVEDEDLIKK